MNAQHHIPQQGREYEVAAAVALIFEVVLGSVLAVYEERQKEGFVIEGHDIHYPRLLYDLRNVLFAVIIETGKLLSARLQGSWAPQVRAPLILFILLLPFN